MQTWDSIPPTHPVHFNLFLAKIVRNLSFNKYRNKYTQKRGRGEIALVLEELEECLAGHSDVEALYIVEELQETINTFVRALPEREGNVFIRRYFYSDSIKDISDRYRMSENNIRVMLNRTRNKLRDRLEKEGYHKRNIKLRTIRFATSLVDICATILIAEVVYLFAMV